MYIRSKKILCASIAAAMVLSTGTAPVRADKSYDSTNVGIISQVDEYIESKGDRAVETLTGIAPVSAVVEMKAEEPVKKAPEKETKAEPKKEKGKYVQFEGKAVAVCETELNIRTEKDADAQVTGYLARYGICDVKEKGDEWTLIESGSCKGYVRTEYLRFGDDAAKWYIDNGFSEVVTVDTDTLTLRGDASVDSECLGMIARGESYDILERGKEWTKIKVSDDLEAFVNNKYIQIGYKTVKAVSVEEQQALLAEVEKESTEGTEEDTLKADENKDAEAKDAAPENTEETTESDDSDEASEAEDEDDEDTEDTDDSSDEDEDENENEDEEEHEEFSDDGYNDDDDEDEDDDDDGSSDDSDSDNSGKTYAAPAGQAGEDIANYALQFVGNPYVWGGTSLTEGADCSGFVQTIYADFGYSLSRCADDQIYDGTRISLDELQPGDLLFYGDDSIGHVAIYIGGGRIVHAASTSQGIITSDYDYHTPCGACRIVNQ